MYNYELKYSTIENQSFSLVKAISYLITYIVSCHIISYVPHYPVKMFLNKQLREGIWETWLAKIQEYDMEIKPLKFIKGQGLCKMMSGIEAVLMGEIVRSSIERVELVRGCLNNPSRLE